MIVLGIESTAHTFSIGIAKNGKKIQILANCDAKYPSPQEGYIPRKLADHHAEAFRETLLIALKEARVSMKEISAVAFSQGSGIGHCLHVGFVAANALSKKLNVPLIPINHSIAHIEIGKELYCKTNDPLIVYVSGGNTQIIVFDKKTKRYHVYGETIDVGLGNFLDVLGRKLKLNPPDAIGVMKSAKGEFIELPYTVRGMNLAFSGLLTFIEKKVIPQVKSKKIKNGDVCFSAQETVFAMLCEAVERALCHTNKKEVLLCGGNARNARLQEMLKEVCNEHHVQFTVTSFEHSGDQGAMIALTGIKILKSKAIPKEVKPKQRLRTDATEVYW